MNDQAARIKRLQLALNRHGAHLTIDGDYGVFTEDATMRQMAWASTKDTETSSATSGSQLPNSLSDAPWMNWMDAHEGWNESKNDKALAAFWKYTTYEAKTVIGRAFAWCAMTINAALFESGFTGNRSAAAKSFVTYGTACRPQFGAIIVIRHADGSHHVSFFRGWVNESQHLVELFGGNQSNSIRRSIYNVSGNDRGHDEIIAVRWPVRA